MHVLEFTLITGYGTFLALGNLLPAATEYALVFPLTLDVLPTEVAAPPYPLAFAVVGVAELSPATGLPVLTAGHLLTQQDNNKAHTN